MVHGIKAINVEDRIGYTSKLKVGCVADFNDILAYKLKLRTKDPQVRLPEDVFGTAKMNIEASFSLFCT